MKYCLKTFWNSFLTFKGTRKLKNEYFQAVFKNKKKNGFWLLFQTNEATFKLWCYFFRDLDVGLTKVCLKTKTKVMKQNLGSLLFYKIRQVPVSKVPKFFEYWHHARIFFEWAIKPFLDTKGLFSLVKIYFHVLILWKVEIHSHTSSFFLRDRDFEKIFSQVEIFIWS